jgi:beta-lactamase regulating signal transducer with metallopeptidase domain
MVHIYQSAFLEALGWSLLDSLWQMGTLWIIYTLLTLNGQKFTSSTRHRLALLTTAGGMAWFFATLLLNYQNAVNDQTLYSLSYFFKDGIGNFADSWRYLDKTIPALSSIYLVAVALYGLRLLVRLHINKKLLGNSLIPVTDVVIACLNRVREKMAIHTKVGIWFSKKAVAPMTVGFLKPLILLPVAVVNNLSTSQVEAVLAHELFHIRRYDYLLNFFAAISEVLFFFNPFARMLTATVRKERENSCDDGVLALGFDAWDYSQALYLLGKHQHVPNTLIIAATGSGKKILLQRIKRMLKKETVQPMVAKPLFAFFLCLAAAVFITKKPHAPLPANQEAAVPNRPAKKTTVPPKVYIDKKDVVVTPVEQRTKVVKAPSKKDVPTKKIEKEPVQLAKQDDVHKPPTPDAPPAPRVVIKYVNDPTLIEFTFMDRDRQEPPKPVNTDKPLPYVPKSTFYYPIDSTRTTISL